MIRKSSLVAFQIILFPIALLISSNNSNALGTISSYYDEIVGSISLVYVSFLIIQNRLKKRDRNIYNLMVSITIIGVVSNIVEGITGNVFVISVDIIETWKPIVCYLAFKNYAKYNRYNMLMFLRKPAKIIITLLFALGIVSQFVDIGVSGSAFFANIKSFMFFWGNALQTASKQIMAANLSAIIWTGMKVI